MRVAEVRRLISVSHGPKRPAKDLLQSIQKEVVALQRFDAIYAALMELQKERIYLISEKQLDEGQHGVRSAIFQKTVLPGWNRSCNEALAIPNLADESLVSGGDDQSLRRRAIRRFGGAVGAIGAVY